MPPALFATRIGWGLSGGSATFWGSHPSKPLSPRGRGRGPAIAGRVRGTSASARGPTSKSSPAYGCLAPSPSHLLRKRAPPSPARGDGKGGASLQLLGQRRRGLAA